MRFDIVCQYCCRYYSRIWCMLCTYIAAGKVIKATVWNVLSFAAGFVFQKPFQHPPAAPALMLSKHQPSLPSGAQAAFAFHSGKTHESIQSLPNGKSLAMNNQQLNRSIDSPKEKENSVKKIHQLPSRCCSCDMNSASKDCTVSAWRCMNSCCSVNSLCIDRKFCVASFQTTWSIRNMHSSCVMWISKLINFVRLSHDTMHTSYFEIDIMAVPRNAQLAGIQKGLDSEKANHLVSCMSGCQLVKRCNITQPPSLLWPGPWIVAGGPMPTNTLHSTQKHKKKMKPYI